MKRSNVQQLNCAPSAPDAANSDPGLASAQKGTKENATTNGFTDVHGGQKTTQKGSSRWRGIRHGDRSCLAPPGRSSLSTPEKSYGVSGAEKGLVGERQLKRWCKLLAECGLQVEWSWERLESTSGIGGTTKPIGVVVVAVGFAGCNGRSTSVAAGDHEDAPSKPGFGRQLRKK